MNKVFVSLAAVWVLCLIVSPVWADGEIKLTPKDLTGADDPLAALSRRYVSPDARAVVGVTMPKDLVGKSALFRVELAKKQTILVVKNADPPVLYVDTNLNGDLTDEKPVTGTKLERGQPLTYRFGPVAATSPDKGRAPVAVGLDVMCYSGGPTGFTAQYAILYPGRCLTGSVASGGKTWSVAFVDGNLDGRYDAFYSGSGTESRGQNLDVFAIDQNGNGKMDTGEVVPLTKMTGMGGAFYTVEVAPNGATARLTAASPKTGTLEVGSADLELVVWSEQGCYDLQGSEGKWPLPVGSYQVAQAHLSKTDTAGVLWTLSVSNNPKFQSFTIREGKTLTQKMGTPLTVRPSIQLAGKSDVSVGLSVVGQGDEEYAAGAEKNGVQQDAPGVTIVDSNRKELASGSFQYG
jgi:hypothetical protein